MKWMIASDLHGSAYYCRKMLEAFEREGADRLFLLGDLLYHGPRNDLPREYAPKEVIPLLNGKKEKLLCVRGNCDAEVDQMVLEFPVLADYAVLPIENSTAGIVSDIYDLLVEYPHYIVGEQELPVEHVLMALPGAKAEEIRTVISHPQALAQCRRFLDSNENWKTEERLNTAAAAKEVSESGDLTMAAVGSPYAAEHFGLQILKEGIFDAQGNTTRFVIISGQKRFVKDAQKISVCMELPHQSGSLYNALAHFIYNDLNMTKIESRPIPQRKWEYRFFVDFEGNLSDPAVKNALRGLQAESAKFRIFGNY